MGSIQFFLEHSLALVIQKMDNTIHWVNLWPVDTQVLSHCIVIYLVDSAIQSLNNRGWSLNYKTKLIQVWSVMKRIEYIPIYSKFEGLAIWIP